MTAGGEAPPGVFVFTAGTGDAAGAASGSPLSVRARRPHTRAAAKRAEASATLPAHRARQSITDSVFENRVTLILGNTGW